MAQLKDSQNNNVLPNTTAENVSYGNSNVAAKIAELEQGGGGGSTPSTDGVALPNIFSQDMVVSGYGTTQAVSDYTNANNGKIEANAQMSCAFVPLDLDSYYCIDGIAFYDSQGAIDINRSLAVLAKGSASSFTNLTVNDFANGSQFPVNNDDFFCYNNLHYIADKRNAYSYAPFIYERDLPIVIKTPAAEDLANPNTTIGLVFNVSRTIGSSTRSIDLSGVHIVKGRYPVEYADSIKGKNMVFFGDSITEAMTHLGHVGIVWDALSLNRADNFGSTGGGADRVADIVLGQNFRGDSNGNQHRKDYARYSAAVIQIGTNNTGAYVVNGEPMPLGQLIENANHDIPDICVYDVQIGIARNGSYAYSDSTKTITEATLNSVEEFFTKCFANTYLGNVALAVQYIQWRNPNCRVYLVTIPDNIGYANYRAINNCIRVLGDKLNVPVIDAANGAMMTQANITYWSKDNWKLDEKLHRYRLTHTNEAGQMMWGSYIANGISKMYYDTDIPEFVVPEDSASYPDRPLNVDPETGNPT